MNAANESVQFLDLMSEFFAKILPIVGVIVLIALVFLVWEIIKFIKGLEPTLTTINQTISKVDESMAKLQAPLNTVESISYSIDSVHEVSRRAVNKSVSMVTDNYVVIKDWVSTFFEDDKKDKVQVEAVDRVKVQGEEVDRVKVEIKEEI